MATNEHSGYPLKWFKDQNAARNSFECAICLEVVEDAVQIRDCGHQFCAKCIEDILKTDPRCPSCRIEISEAAIFEDHAARRMIKQLNVNCCNEGCSWVGCLSSLLQDHQNSCNFLICSGNNISQLDVGKLGQTLEALPLRVSTLETKCEQDELRLFMHEQDKIKHEQDIKELKLKHDEDVRVLRQDILMLRTMPMPFMRATHAPQTLQQPLPRQEPEPAYTLKIANFPRKLARAKSDNDVGDIESEPFFSSHGYKMRLEVCLNEGPVSNTGYMGIYLALLKSDRDSSLPWPFTKPYTVVLVDQQDDLNQRQNIKYGTIPHGEESYKRPRTRENDALGNKQFVLHSTLRTRKYIRDHAVYIKVVVDP